MNFIYFILIALFVIQCGKSKSSEDASPSILNEIIDAWDVAKDYPENALSFQDE